MIIRVEKYPFHLLRGAPSEGKPDRLLGPYVDEMRSTKTTINSWHATCRSLAVSKILDWLVK